MQTKQSEFLAESNRNTISNKAAKKILFSTLVTTLSMSSFASSSTTAGTSTSAVKSDAPAATTQIAKKSSTATSSTTSSATVTVANSLACGAGTACFVVSDTSNRAIALINRNAEAQMMNVVISQFDFKLMTKYAMGNNWKLAKEDEQTKLVSLFQQLLVKTYSTALSKFKGASTNIISATVSTPDPSKPKIQKTEVVCQITLPNSEKNTPIKVEYDLANNTGPWKAYDIKIENASLVTTYRTQFNDVVQNKKIPGLIQQLQDKVNSLQASNNSDTE
ncbi:MAG TPA: ABC transporter substrate-binding protein [Aquella sp.]|nr:ABC transporter substrate-binding protein [Aquella sp.]